MQGANGHEFPHMTGCEDQALVFRSEISHCRTVRSSTSRPTTTEVIVVVRPYIDNPNSVWNSLPMVRATQRARPSWLRSSDIAPRLAA